MTRRKKLPVFLNKKEQQQLLSIFNTRYIASQRNKTMCLLFLKAGLRLSEMINLEWTRIDFNSGQLSVINGKGNKDRIVYISSETITSLSNWRNRQVSEWGISSYVFSNRKCLMLIDRDVREMVTKYAEKAGISKRVSPHVLRHTFATELLRQSKNIRIVQKALGHSDLSTTMIYTHVVDDDMRDAMIAL
jgi:site-specific recombinase XerD